MARSLVRCARVTKVCGRRGRSLKIAEDLIPLQEPEAHALLIDSGCRPAQAAVESPPTDKAIRWTRGQLAPSAQQLTHPTLPHSRPAGSCGTPNAPIHRTFKFSNCTGAILSRVICLSVKKRLPLQLYSPISQHKRLSGQRIAGGMNVCPA
jgi:hypothetical protein